MGRFALFLTFFLLGVGSSYAERVHVVQKSETLGGIANKYGGSGNGLPASNGIKGSNLLFVGKNSENPAGSAPERPSGV